MEGFTNAQRAHVSAAIMEALYIQNDEEEKPEKAEEEEKSGEEESKPEVVEDAAMD